MANENDVDVKFGADLSGLKQGFQDAASKVSEGAKAIGSSLGIAATSSVALGTAVERLGEQLIAFVKDNIREAITGFGELGDSIEHLQHRIGGSAQDLSVLKVGLESVGISTETYQGIARKLPQVLAMHASSFKAAGIAYTDAEGKLLPVQDVITNLNAHLEKFTAGSARNTEGVNLMGRAFYMMADMVEMTKSRMAEASDVAETFGEVLSDKDLEAASEFRRQTGLLHTALRGFGLEIGRAVEPVLTELARVARDVAAPAFTVFKTVVEALAALLNGLSVAGNILVNSFAVIIATSVSVVKALNALFHGDVKGAEDAWNEWKTTSKAALDDVLNHTRIVNERMKALLEGPGKAPPEPHPDDPNRGKRTPGDLAIVDAQAKRLLEAEKERLREAGELNESWHRQELESDGTYWATKIKIEQEGLDAQIASLRTSLEEAKNAEKGAVAGSEEQKNAKATVISLLSQIEVAEAQRKDAFINGQRQMKEATDTRVRSELTAEIENAKNIALAKIDAESTVLARKKDLRLINDAEEVKESGDLELRKLAVQRDALTKQQALYDQWSDKYKTIQQQIQLLDAQTAAKREELTTKAIEQQRIKWKSLFDSMESGFQGTLRDFMKGMTTVGEALNSLFNNVVDAIIGELARMGAAWMAQQIAQMVFGKVTAISTIQGEAAKAGAGGVASMAAAPFPMDLAAPEFGAAMFSAAAAYSAMPGLAVGSWNVPEDSFTKIHKGEMIMPEQFAEPIRSGMKGGSIGGNVEVHIHAADAKSVERMFMQNGSALMSVIGHKMRGFHGRSKF